MIHIIYVVPVILALATLAITGILSVREAREIIAAKDAEIAEQKRLLDWLEAREVLFEKMVLAAKYAMASRIPPDSFGAFFANGMLSKNGVAAAPHLYEQHKAMIEVHRLVTKEIRDAYEALARWEQANPVPIRVTFEVEEDYVARLEDKAIAAMNAADYTEPSKPFELPPTP